jgi:two-component system sensor histidine kinase RegB
LTDLLKQSFDEEINLKLRTLNLIHWTAIFGQFFAVIIAYFYFEISFSIYLCIFLILLSVVLNILVSIFYPLTKILNYNETFLILVFDLLQLVGLLFLTGGLTNPFSVLILAPLVIAATYLDLKRIIIITLVAIISLNFLAFFYYPLESNALGISQNEFSSFEIFLIWSALIIATIFLTFYCFRVADDARRTRKALKETQLSLSNEEKISALMGLTAAAVHELGTPLSTISVITKELVNNNDDEQLKEDLNVIQSQLKRCSNILERLRSNSLDDKNNEFINQLDFIRLINEITSTYDNNNINIIITNDPYFENINVTIPRSAEIVHSITNIVDNAFKFANSQININLISEEDHIIIEVADDGPGFAPEIFPFLGEPYIKNNNKAKKQGLGLGLFISKNLLAKSQGEIKFSHRESGGGLVKIVLSKNYLNLSNE